MTQSDSRGGPMTVHGYIRSLLCTRRLVSVYCSSRHSRHGYVHYELCTFFELDTLSTYLVSLIIEGLFKTANVQLVSGPEHFPSIKTPSMMKLHVQSRKDHSAYIQGRYPENFHSNVFYLSFPIGFHVRACKIAVKFYPWSSCPMTILNDDRASSGLAIASTFNSLYSLRSSSQLRIHRTPNLYRGTAIGPFGFHIIYCSDHGYYGCCCKDSFDDEHLDMQIQREMERTRDKTIHTFVKPVETEPGSTDSMTCGGVIQTDAEASTRV
ncbi:hypothetical protein L210DRAFT_2040275 [Boletus edulis BED1]|uniref:Uncharacterized protein n=1 Tax=Boletus edulis BED1 TaxID=1328754 RepID=A0AAD4GMA5_BOLED|nr:hypothetical protein L210DRAFT_2040275 [Boletus edulis BED1]